MTRPAPLAAALVAALAAATASPAMAFGVRVVGDLDAALDPEQARAARAEACAALAAGWPPPAGRVWLRAAGDGFAALPDAGATPEAAAYWAELALGARALAERLLGGPAEIPPDLALMVETGAGGAALFDGRATRPVADPCAALESMAAALGAGGATGGGGAAGPAATDAEAAAPPVALRAGDVAEVAITDLPPASAEDGATLILKGPDGVAGEAARDGADGARGWVAAAADARPGPGRLSIYRADDPFRPIGEATVMVAPGPAAAARPAALSAGGVVEAEAPIGGETALPLTLAEDGRLSLRSLGPLDLAARLERADGTAVAADDDGGARYGFALDVDLEAGEYVLRVRHCCGGGGRFAVAADRR